MSRKIQIGCTQYHFKVCVAHVLGLAKHTETGEILVIYECYAPHFPEYESDRNEDIYARPIEMFLSEVDHEKYPDVEQKYRFELIEERDENALDIIPW